MKILSLGLFDFSYFFLNKNVFLMICLCLSLAVVYSHLKQFHVSYSSYETQTAEIRAHSGKHLKASMWLLCLYVTTAIGMLHQCAAIKINVSPSKLPATIWELEKSQYDQQINYCVKFLRLWTIIITQQSRIFLTFSTTLS